MNFRVDEKLLKDLDDECALAGKTRSEVAREVLAASLRVKAWQRICARVQPYAQRAGYLTDEDVMKMMNEEREKRREQNRKRAEAA